MEAPKPIVDLVANKIDEILKDSPLIPEVPVLETPTPEQLKPPLAERQQARRQRIQQMKIEDEDYRAHRLHLQSPVHRAISPEEAQEEAKHRNEVLNKTDAFLGKIAI